VTQCWQFFCRVTDELREFPGMDNQAGPRILLQFLVKLCKRDFELWWKHFRRSDGKDGRDLSYPILFYLLNGDSNLVSNIRKSVVSVFQSVLEANQDMTEIRQLVSMCGLLLAHMDTQERQGFIYSGRKLEFSVHLAETLSHCGDESQLFTELSLMQPPWLGLLVSRRLIMIKKDKCIISNITELSSKFDQITITDDYTTSIPIDCLAQKIFSSCHLHTVLRTHWQHSAETEVNNVQIAWRMMDRLDKTVVKSQPGNKAIRFRSGISFRMSQLVDDLNTVVTYVNGQKTLVTTIALSSLLFKMSSPTHY